MGTNAQAITPDTLPELSTRMVNRVVCCTSRLRRYLPGVVFGLLLLGGCGGPPPPAPSPAPEPEPAPPPLPQVVWTARPEVTVRRGTTAVALERPFTRLDVAGRDSTGMLVVTCAYCEPLVSGLVAESDVVVEPRTPQEAAAGSIAEFALAVRDAAAWRRIEDLTPVMASDFTFGFSAQRDRAITLTAWEWERFRNLDQVPRLLDEGMVEIETDFWVAPVEYAGTPGYQGLRLGFRRSAETGRWEWLFLVRGEGRGR